MSQIFSVLTALCIVALGITGQAEAEVSHPVSYVPNTYGNLHYYTSEGAIEPAVTISPTLRDESASSYNNLPVKQTYRTSTSTDVTVTYGLIDRYWVYFSEDYLWRNETSSTDVRSSKTTTTETRGAADPTVGFGWRILQDPAAGVFGNLSVNYSPMLGRRDSATATQEGNNAKGASSGGLSAGLFGVEAAHEYAVNLNVTHRTPSASTANNPAASSTSDASTSLNLNPRFRWHATERLYAQAGAYLYYPQVTVSRSNANANADVNSQPLHLQENLGAGFLLTPKLLVSMFLSYMNYDYDETFSGGGGRTTTSTRTGVDMTVATQL